MTPEQARKLERALKIKQALSDILHETKKDETTPTIEDLQQLFDEFVKRQDKKSADKLLAGVVRWEVGEL